MLTRRTSRVLAVACLACTAVSPVPARATPDSPAVQSTDIPALVRQLGDADFRTREAAHKRLREIGKPAMPALRDALSGDDPEVCSRADSLLRQIERPRIPPGWFTDPTGWRRNELLRNGARVVEIIEGDRRVAVSEGPGGIEMNVRGVDEGTPINLTFRARDASDLRLQDPEAHAVYERVRVRSGVILRGRRIVPAVPMPPVPIPRPAPMPRLMPEQLPPGMIQPLRPAPRPPAVRLLPLAPEGGLLRPPADDLLGLEARLSRQMRDAGVEAAEQQAVLEALRMLRDIQVEGRLLTPEDLEAQIKKYNALSDAVRQKLDDLKLPGPGDALPPPARARLGVSIATLQPEPNGPGGALVTMVIPGSRGEKLGLREGDIIRRINDNRIDDAASLRRVLTDTKEPLVITIKRAEEPALQLREKPQ